MDKISWPNKNSGLNTGSYNYAAPNQNIEPLIETRLIGALAKTPAFKRLSGVRFLGALDYCLVNHPNGSRAHSRFTRAQHSIGVAALSRLYLKLRNHDVNQRLLCISAALLHDIGHPPFSHTLEPLFKEHFGLDHHIASERIIMGQEPYGAEVAAVLNDFGVKSSDVVDVLNGSDEKFEGFFSGPINFDTIEGILRSRSYLKMQQLGLTPPRVVEAAAKRYEEKSRDIVDEFWHAKHDMYTLMIRSRSGVLCDLLFQEVVKRSIHLLDRQDFYMTESHVFKKVPFLRDVLDRGTSIGFVRSVLPDVVPYQVRHFYINNEASFDCREDTKRYKQLKFAALLTLEEMVPS